MTHSKILLTGALLLASLGAAVPAAAAAEWSLDAAHSTVGFQVKHLAVTKVNGSFGRFTGSFTFEPGRPETWTAEAAIEVASITTGNQKRDEHLVSADFFDAAQFPEITFKSTGVTLDGENTGVVTGDLTMHGVTLPVTLAMEISGPVTDPWGGRRLGFSLSGTLDRSRFGLSYGGVMEGGGLIIGNDVKLMIELEGVQQ